MSDVEARLAALDPAADQPYRHADLDAMIARIVTTPERARSTHWQRLQARFGFGLITATLATALTLVATQAPTSLPALALARALTTPSASFSAALPMATYEDVHFSATSTIPARPPSLASFELKLPSNAKSEIARLARVFDVAGKVRNTNGSNIVTITSASGAALSYDAADVPQWYYSSTSPKVAPAEKSASASVAMPSHAAVESVVRRYVSQLGYNYTLSAPSFSTATTSTTTPAGAPLTVSSETADYTVVVDGADTDQSISFTVDPANTLLYAEGPAFDVGKGVALPASQSAHRRRRAEHDRGPLVRRRGEAAGRQGVALARDREFGELPAEERHAVVAPDLHLFRLGHAPARRNGDTHLE